MTLAAILGCAMTMTVMTACSHNDNDDDTSPVVDDKAWKADANKDTSVRPGDDFFMYCNGAIGIILQSTKPIRSRNCSWVNWPTR